MSESDGAADAARIAAALGMLRGPRPSRPPFGPGDLGPGGPWGRGHHGHAAQHDLHAAHHGRGAWRGDQGPMGRFAARFRLLEALAAASDPLSVSELAERIGVDQPRASRLVQAGVDSGHVRREANATDARRTDILLTDEGRALIAQFRGARTDAVAQALAGFTPDERTQLARLLAKLADAWPKA